MSYKKGLSKKEVELRFQEGLRHTVDNNTKSIKQILREHLFTYFNFINIFLAFLIILAAIIDGNLIDGLKNCLFLGVVFCNTIIGIIQELYSKRIVDRLSVIASNKVKAIRDSKEVEISLEEIVLDDVLVISQGGQVVVDSIILEGEVEVNESFITGEAEPVFKTKGELLLSGSFIISGSCYVKVRQVGANNYISKISNEAKVIRKSNSVIMKTFEKLLKIISVLIVPIGLVLFLNQYFVSHSISEAVFATCSGLIGMIPEGLILLTSSVMAVSILKLSKYNVLVQDLYCSEMLARVDVICLDKTGTITDGNMELVDVIEFSSTKEILSHICGSINDNSPTFKAIREKYESKSDWKVISYIPFSSQRKKLEISFEKYGTFILGAPEYVLKNYDDKLLKKYQEKYRVLALVDGNDNLLAYLLIKDSIRQGASDTFKYFNESNVSAKIISGDNLNTVMNVVKTAGLNNLKGIDLSLLDDKMLYEVVFTYDIFARVTPEEKKKIVEILQKSSKIVAMTGDGVNDVLALKQSDCAITVRDSNEACKSVSQLILLDSNFLSIPKIIKEGRRLIYNMKRSASLLLTKTIFTICLIVLCMIIGKPYFFVPIQLTLISVFTIGIPSFFLALEDTDEKVTKGFFKDILKNSIPVALTVVFNIILLLILQTIFSISNETFQTIAVLITAFTLFGYLFRLCLPLNLYRIILYFSSLICFLLISILFKNVFELVSLSFIEVIFTICLFLLSIIFYILIRYLIFKILEKPFIKKIFGI